MFAKSSIYIDIKNLLSPCLFTYAMDENTHDTHNNFHGWVIGKIE